MPQSLEQKINVDECSMHNNYTVMPGVYESKELHLHHVICFPKMTRRRKMSSNYILVTLKNFHSRLKMKT